MGLRSPQENRAPALRPQGSTRFTGGQAPRIGTEFANTLAKNFAAEEKARLEQEKEQASLIRAQAENAAEELRIQAQGELAQTEGAVTLDTHVKQRQELTKKFEKISEKVPERFRSLVDIDLQKSILKYEKSATPYMAGQSKKLKDDTFAANSANKLNYAVEVSGNPEEFGEGLRDLTESITTSARRKFGSNDAFEIAPGLTAGEMVQNEVKTGVSMAVFKSIEQQAAVGDLPRASRLFADHNDKLLPADRVKVAATLDRAMKNSNTRFSIQLVNDANLQGDSLTQRELYIRAAAPNDDVYKEAIQIMNYQDSVKQRDKDRNEEAQIASIYSAAEKGQDVTMMLGQLPPGKVRDQVRKRLYETRGGSNIVTDWKVYNSLSEKMISMTPAEAQKVKLGAYSMDIAPEQMANLEAIRNDRVKALQTEKDQAQKSTVKDADDIFKAYADQMKIIDPAERGRVRGIVHQEWERLKGDKNITIKELRARLYSTLQQRGPKILPKREKGILWDTVKPPETNTLKPDLSKVPEDVRLKFRKQHMRAFGRPATLEEEDKQMERLISAGKIVLPE